MNIIKITIAALLTLVTIGSAFGQAFDYEAAQAQIAQYSANMDQIMQQEMRRVQAQTNAANAEVIRQYREENDDYQTPDHVCLQRARAKWESENPEQAQYWRNRRRQTQQESDSWMAHSQRMHNMRMNDINSWGNTNRQIANTYSEIGDINMRGYYNRNAMTDRGQHRTINGIHERGDYYNPNTGNTYNMGYQPNTYQTDGDSSFYTDGNYNQYQHDGFQWQELEEMDDIDW